MNSEFPKYIRSPTLSGALVRFASQDVMAAERNWGPQECRADLLKYFREAPKDQVDNLNEFLLSSLSRLNRLGVSTGPITVDNWWF